MQRGGKEQIKRCLAAPIPRANSREGIVGSCYLAYFYSSLSPCTLHLTNSVNLQFAQRVPRRTSSTAAETETSASSSMCTEPHHAQWRRLSRSSTEYISIGRSRSDSLPLIERVGQLKHVRSRFPHSICAPLCGIPLCL